MANKTIDQVLVGWGLSPNEVGIRQVDGQLQVFPRCCVNGYCHWSSRDFWYCSACKEPLPHSASLPVESSIIGTHLGEWYIKVWVSKWIGIPEDQLTVGVNE